MRAAMGIIAAAFMFASGCAQKGWIDGTQKRALCCLWRQPASFQPSRQATSRQGRQS